MGILKSNKIAIKKNNFISMDKKREKERRKKIRKEKMLCTYENKAREFKHEDEDEDEDEDVKLI